MGKKRKKNLANNSLVLILDFMVLKESGGF